MSWKLTDDAERVQFGYVSHGKTPGSGGYHPVRGLRPGIMGLDAAPPDEMFAVASTVRNRLALLGRKLPHPEYRCYGWASSLPKGWWPRMTGYVLGRWEKILKSSGLYVPIRATMYGLPVSCRHFLALLETYIPDSNTFLTGDGELGLALHEMHQVSGLLMGDYPYQEYFPSNRQLWQLKHDDPDMYDTLWDLTCHYHTALIQISPPAKTKRKISLRQFANYLFQNLEGSSSDSVRELDILTVTAVNELVEKSGAQSYTTASVEGAFPAGTKFRSFLCRAQKSIKPRSLLAGYLALWLKKCVVPHQCSDALPLEVLFPAVQLAHGRELSLLPAMVASIHCGLRSVVRSFTQVGPKPSTVLICPKVELPYAYLMAWLVLHPVGEDQQELQVRKGWEFFKCFPQFSGRYGDILTDDEKPRSNRTILDIGCFRWLINIRVGYLVFRVKNRCYIEPYLPCRFARQFGYDQLYIGNPSRGLRVEGGLVDGVRAWLWTMAGCTGAHFALPSYRRRPKITFLSCKWLLSAYEFIGVKTFSELESDYSVRAAMMAARKAEIAQKQGKRRGKSSLDDEVETPEGEFADIDTDQGELGTGRTTGDHEPLASHSANPGLGDRAATISKPVRDQPVGSVRTGTSKRKKTAYKPSASLCFLSCASFQHFGYFADVAREGLAGDGVFPDVSFEERGYAPVPGFSKPDAGLLADMLAEQTSERPMRPLFESGSFTGPGDVPDAAIAAGVFPPPPNDTTDLPTRVDTPPMTTPVGTSDSVGSQPEGTSTGTGSRSSLYEHVHALLVSTDPDRDVFRMDLGYFTTFYNGMIEKLLQRGCCFDQFRRSFSRHMVMMREEGHPELADSFTAEFAILESEILELRELKAGGASSFASSQVEDRLAQWHELRSSVGSELRSREHTVAQLMATLARKDTSRAEIVSSLDSTHAEIARLKEALERAEESAATITEELVGLERSREWTLDRLGSAQEGLMKLRSEAAEVLNSSEDSVRASLQAEFEQDYMDRLSGLESHILSRRLPSG
ncbi:uncharacterized protein LOC109828310 [Asparagus officinalis]|uniref:uncharacterized protein LOC109828310 n=1 Tax=Asparagus officinalis TaxID=4686 RepID=UPI00098E410A|nr:uncharacterized protein LOC109828310 [Asparagus officinalis]